MASNLVKAIQYLINYIEMKQLKYFITSLFIISSVAVFAAEPDSSLIKRNITIEKEYIPTIQEAGKVNDIPSVVEPELKKIEVNYSGYSTLIDPPFEIRQLESARLTYPALLSQKDGYLRLGLGNYWTTLGNFMYPIVNKPKHRLELSFNHEGTFDDKKFTDNTLALNYHRYYTSGEFFMNGGYEYEGFNYYGKPKLDESALYNMGTYSFTGSQYFNKDASISGWNFAMGYNSIPTEEKQYNFSAQFKYSGFSPNEGLKEHNVTTNILYERKVDENKWGVDMNLHNLVYNSTNVKYTTLTQTGYSIFSLNPYFDFQQETWYLHLGFAANFSGQGTAFAPTPDIKAQYTLVDKTIYCYGGIVGDLQANTMKEMVALNHYIDLNEKIKNTYTPFNMYGGIKLKLLYNFVTDFSLGYKTIKDQYFFVNKAVTDSASQVVNSNVFGAEYHDANLFYTSFKINYNFNQEFGFVFNWKHNSWKVTDGTAWQMPKNEFDFGTDMKLTKRTSVNINTYFKTGRVARATDGSSVSLKSMADVNFGLFYAHSSKVSSFFRLNNIINRHYEQWYGYEVNGFNAMFGLTFAF